MENKLPQLIINCRCGGKTLSLRGDTLDGAVLVTESRWETVPGGSVFRADLVARRDLTLESVRLLLPCPVGREDRMFLNGYQSWTDSMETLPGAPMRGLDKVPKFLLRRFGFESYGDYRFARYPDAHGFSYGYLRRGKEYTLFASLSERSGFTLFYPLQDRKFISVEKDCRGLVVKAGQRYGVFRLALLIGSEDEVFDRWFALMSLPKPKAKPLAGYTSWYQHYENISQPLLEKSLAAAPDDWQVFQVDDGWECRVGDWIPDPDKFPDGMIPLASAIRERGMVPGLWLAPFAAAKNSRVCEEHPDWLVRDDSGQPLLCGSNWGGFYALDFELPAVQDHLEKLFGTVVKLWGYGLLKLDFLYAACCLPRNNKTRGELMCRAMELLRRWAGDARILACGVPLMPAFGLADYCRIGTDVSLRYDDTAFMRLFHRERVSTKFSLLNTVFRRQLNGRAFLNDPDVSVLRPAGHHLSKDQRTVLALVSAVLGGVRFTSDDPAQYGEAEQTLLARCRALSGARVRGAELRGYRLALRCQLPDGTNGELAWDIRNGKVLADTLLRR